METSTNKKSKPRKIDDENFITVRYLEKEILDSVSPEFQIIPMHSRIASEYKETGDSTLLRYKNSHGNMREKYVADTVPIYKYHSYPVLLSNAIYDYTQSHQDSLELGISKLYKLNLYTPVDPKNQKNMYEIYEIVSDSVETYQDYNLIEVKVIGKNGLTRRLIKKDLLEQPYTGKLILYAEKERGISPLIQISYWEDDREKTKSLGLAIKVPSNLTPNMKWEAPKVINNYDELWK